MKDDIKSKTIHGQCALGVDMVMKSSLVRRTLDNVTILLVGFQNFESIFNEQSNIKSQDKLTPKSSFYLSNAIENKEHLLTDTGNNNSSSNLNNLNNYYCNSEPNSLENKINTTSKANSRIAHSKFSEKDLLKKSHKELDYETEMHKGNIKFYIFF